MKAAVQRITLPKEKRAVCVSDIHGSLDLFEKLLDKVGYTGNDLLILVGDLYTKGAQGHETLRTIMALSQKPDVYVLRGNCDWHEEYLSDEEKAWLDGLPHILVADDYVFVHGGLPSTAMDADTLEAHEAFACLKHDAFMERGLVFEKYVVAGHWPVSNYTHEIPCYNPIVNHKQRIISIDGGNVIKNAGQLNAFVILDGAFSFASVDALPAIRVEKTQAERGGTLNITWNDRQIEPLEEQGEFTLCRHLHTGKVLPIPSCYLWTDGQGSLCAGEDSTDYYLPVEAGETVSLVKSFDGRMLAKKNGVVGWIEG